MRTKLLLFQVLALSCVVTTQAQNVGIGTTTPAASAALDVNSTNKGILIPRMTTAQRTAIVSPTNGLMVFDTTTNTFWFYKSNVWVQLSPGITLPYDCTHNANDIIFKVTNTNHGGSSYAIVGNASGYGTAVAGTADSSGAGVFGASVYGAGVEGFSYNIGGRFSSDGSGAGVSGFSSDGPGGEFESDSGPAIKALGRVEVTGNVGIGTAVPAQKLDVFKGRLRFSGDISANEVQGIEFTNGAGTALNGFIGKYNDSMMGFYGYTGAGWKTLFNNTNGNVGLQGNTNPRAPLSFSNGIGNKISIFDNGDGTHYGIGLQAAQLQLYVPSIAQDIVMGYGSSAAFTENMRVKGNGNVGIGTATPSEKLQVNGNVKVGGTLQVQGGSPGAGKVLTSDGSGNASWQAPATVITPVGFVADKSGGDVTLLTNSGWVKIPFNTTGNYVQGSAYSSANSEFTVPASGLYTFDVKLLFNGFTGTATNTGGIYIAIFIRDAGNTFGYAVYEYTFIPSVSTYFTQGFSATVNLAANTIIDVRVGNGSNGAITVTGPNISGLRTHFSGYRVM